MRQKKLLPEYTKAVTYAIARKITDSKGSSWLWTDNRNNEKTSLDEVQKLVDEKNFAGNWEPPFFVVEIIRTTKIREIVVDTQIA